MATTAAQKAELRKLAKEVVDELPFIRLPLRRAIGAAVDKSLAPLETKVARLERERAKN